MRIAVQFDTSSLKARTQREQRRLAFNTAQALNETAKKIQTAERVNLDRKLTIRKAGFMYRLIKITAFASARAARPFAEIAIDPTKNVLLGKLERGGVKQPTKGGSVAVPVTGGPVRPSFQQQAAPALWFRKLRFRRHVTQTGKAQYKGLLRTFIIPGVGVFQRGARAKTVGRKVFVGRGGHRLRNKTLATLLYSFQKGPRLKAMLGFIDIATRTFSQEWSAEFRKAYRK